MANRLGRRGSFSGAAIPALHLDKAPAMWRVVLIGLFLWPPNALRADDDGVERRGQLPHAPKKEQKGACQRVSERSSGALVAWRVVQSRSFGVSTWSRPRVMRGVACRVCALVKGPRGVRAADLHIDTR